MKITQTPTTDLIPYVNNAKIHSDMQVDKIAASIQEFGFVNPVIIDSENVVIAGHGRLLAAQKLSLKQVPTIQADDLTPAQVKAYRLADNRLSEIGTEWDYELVSVEVDQLLEEDFDIDLTGFDESLAGEEADADWEGMPDFENNDNSSFREIKVHFANESDVREFAELMNQDITDKTKYIWHPKAERLKVAGVMEYGEE